MKKSYIIFLLLVLGGIFTTILTVNASSNTLVTIDFPSVNENVQDNVFIRGWIMSKEDNVDLEIYIDNKKITEEINRHERNDVISLIKDYGDETTNRLPGYQITVDLSYYSYGNHNVTVKAVKNGNVLASATREFIRKVPATMISIDIPSSNEKIANDTMTLKGWVMSEYQNPTLEIYLDDVKQEVDIDRHERGDVISLIKDYGSASINSNPGYLSTLDVRTLEYGNHTVKVVAKDKVGNTLYEETRKFVKKAPATMISIDIPSSNEKITNDTMTLKGWVMSEYQNPTLEIYLDDVKQEVDIDRHERGDVISLIKDYGSASINSNPGYLSTLDVRTLEYGNHTVKVVAKDKVGNTLYEETRKFVKKKPDTMLSIDIPAINEKVNRNFSVQGWLMSEDKDSYIVVDIDGEVIETSIKRNERADVLNVIKGYGGVSNNPLPGYSTANIDLSNYLDGTHKVTVSVYSKNGQFLTSETRTFELEKYNSTINISSPTNTTYKNSLEIKGYVLSEASNTNIDLYIDNNLIAENIDRFNENTLDSSLYEDYGGVSSNPLPNYTYSYNVTDLLDGSHTLTVKLKLATGEVIETKNVKFNVSKYESLITVDFPNPGNVNKNDNLFIRGWVMSEDRDTTVKLYLDNKEIVEPIDRHEREDVLQAISGYGGRETNSLPGYSATVDLSNYSTGYHTLTIKIFNHLNEEFNRYDKTLYIYDGFDLGIDVSQHNGNIDWNTVKSSGGVDFAFIRLGYRGYGAAGNIAIDTQFISNINSANNAGIDTGIYFFSQATNYQEGADEARYVLNTLNMNPGLKEKLDYPIMLDVEYSTDPTGNGRADHISNEARSEAVRGFLETMNSYGLRPGIYANKDFLTNKLDLTRFNNYDTWLAHWTYDFNKKSDYNGAYKIWQYSNCGSISGINGCVDLDISYQN